MNIKDKSRTSCRLERIRNIRKKSNIIRNLWGSIEYEKYYNSPKNLGKLSKGKPFCSCIMCKPEKYFKIPKAKYKNKIKVMKKEIQNYTNET